MDRIKKYWFPVTGFAISLLSALFWVALRVNHSGISKFLGADKNQSFLIMNLPVMVTVLAWVGVIFALAGLKCWDKKKWPAIAGFAIGLLMAVAAVVVIIFGAKDYLRFILVHYRKSLVVTGCILVFSLVLLFPPKIKTGIKYALIALVVAAAVVVGYQLRPCEISCGAVVYAVEDDYQIVFSTSDSAIAWVEIDGENYYDLYAGSMRSADRVHKIEVPQSVLDEAGSYRICARQMIYRGPFGGYTGDTISESYAFRPVDSSDGLNYFALSDVHEAVDAATRAATSQDDTDFIVLLGDLVSMVETEADANLANDLAHGITGGEIPVIYARGNHEIKGEYGEVLYKYVGSKNQEYYYTVTLSNEIFAVVLDLGEDHEDDWWEYYGTAQFDLYRQKQTEMLEEILAEGEYENYRYRMALCHIPIVFLDGKFNEFRMEWTELLNKMDIDMCLSGHKHKLWPFVQLNSSCTTPRNLGGAALVYNFPGFLVGRRSLVQEGGTQSNGYDQYTGLSVRVNFAQGIQTACYVNSLHEILEIKDPFVGGTCREFLLDLKHPEK